VANRRGHEIDLKLYFARPIACEGMYLTAKEEALIQQAIKLGNAASFCHGTQDFLFDMFNPPACTSASPLLGYAVKLSHRIHSDGLKLILIN
jgi:hypothetical protein